LAYNSVQVDSKVKLQLGLRVGGHLAVDPTFTSELSHMASRRTW